MVGALADWFAVTALFRHPLGIPIPHTAIIPSRKDQIGRSLGEFVEGNFLTREVLAERLRGRPRRPAPRPLAGRAGARRSGPSAALGDAMQGVIEVLDDRDVQDALGGIVERRLRATRRRAAARQGHRRRPSRAATTSACSTPSSTRPRRVPRREPSRRCASRLDAGVAVVGARADRRPHLQQDLQRRADASSATSRDEPDHEVRAVDRASGSARSPSGCATDPELIAKVEELKDELLAHPEVQAWLRVAVGRVEAGDARRRRRPRQRAAPPARRRAAHGSGSRLASRRRAAGARSTTGSSAPLVLRRRALPQRGRRPHRHHGRSAGTAATRPGASSCRSAATCSSSASTARSSAASPAWSSTPSATGSSSGRYGRAPVDDDRAGPAGDHAGRPRPTLGDAPTDDRRPERAVRPGAPRPASPPCACGRGSCPAPRPLLADHPGVAHRDRRQLPVRRRAPRRVARSPPPRARRGADEIDVVLPYRAWLGRRRARPPSTCSTPWSARRPAAT